MEEYRTFPGTLIASRNAAAESRTPRFAELDAQIQAEAERRQGKQQRKPNPRRRSAPPLPAAVRKEIRRLARALNGQHGRLFLADPKLKDRAGRFLKSLLLPKPRRRGRPGMSSVTTAINLLGRLRRQYPAERRAKIWQRIYPEVIANYAGMNAVDQKYARQVLRERVRWRMRTRRRRMVSGTGRREQ